MIDRIYYRKEKLRGACWEYQVDGGWVAVPSPEGDRSVLHHRFTFYRPREVTVRTPDGVQQMERTGAEQWFFTDRWFSLLRFTARNDVTVGYYVNFSLPLAKIKPNYYRDLDLELDLWLDPDGTATELDRDEFNAEIQTSRLQPDWARHVNEAFAAVSAAVCTTVNEIGPDLDSDRNRVNGLPGFILRV